MQLLYNGLESWSGEMGSACVRACVRACGVGVVEGREGEAD